MKLTKEEGRQVMTIIMVSVLALSLIFIIIMLMYKRG